MLSTTDSLFLSLFIRLVFRLRGVGICFDGYIHLSTWFQADLIATFIAQSILDPNLSIEFQQHLPNERLSSLQRIALVSKLRHGPCLPFVARLNSR